MIIYNSTVTSGEYFYYLLYLCNIIGPVGVETLGERTEQQSMPKSKDCQFRPKKLK